jgi:serine/threonine protein kinase
LWHSRVYASDLDFILMEYVTGKTLDEIIPRKDMKLSDALNYAVQIADALSRPQAAGVVLKY